MKKLTPLFILAILLSGCSTESIDSEELLVADAKPAMSDPNEFIVPETICAGETASFEIVASMGSNLQVQEYNTTIEEWEQVFQIAQSVSNPTIVELMWETPGTYDLRYKVGKGGFNAIQITVVLCDNDPVCAYGKGYWTNHGPVNPGNQEDAYPEGGVLVGNEYFELAELQEILQTNGNTGIVYKMKQQLITALLNIANGVDGTSITAVIDEANSIIIANGEGYTAEQINSVKDELEAFVVNNSCPDSGAEILTE